MGQSHRNLQVRAKARELSRWRTTINSDVRVGTVACVFQGVALYKLWKDMQGGMDHERTDASWKFVGGIASAGGSMADVLGNVLKGRATAVALRYGVEPTLSAATKRLLSFGGRAGVITGMIMACFDLKSANDQIVVEHNGWMDGLYIASAALNLIVLYAFWSASTGWGIVLTVVLVIVAILIAVFQDDNIQEWFKRCLRGKFQGKGTPGIDYYTLPVDFLWIVATGQVPGENGLWPVIFAGCGVLSVIAMLGLSMAGKELFRWTYYPIALDRKNRMVHVFRLNGTVLSVPWDEVFFTLGRGKGIFGALNWDLRGLILDKDRKTVRETFAFSAVIDQEAAVVAHWEFLRRYMEEGPAAVIDAIKLCMPADGQREPAAAGRERIFVNDLGMSGAMWLIMWPFNTLHAWVRRLVMRTSRIPQWPAGVAAMLTVAADDPYVRDASMNPADLR